MRKGLVFIFAFFLVSAASVCSAEEIDLVGEWRGPLTLHGKQGGFVSNDGSNCKIIFLEQKDGAFHGKKVWTRHGRERSEDFSGVAGPDGKKLYLAGHADGYFFADVLGPDEIVLYYLEDGGAPKAIRRRLKKIK